VVFWRRAIASYAAGARAYRHGAVLVKGPTMGIDTTRTGQGGRSRLFDSGEIADVSGDYLIVNPDGGEAGEIRSVAKGDRMPPTPQKGQRYRFLPVAAIFTTVVSAQTIAATATEFRVALENLAKK